jgi:hypothetical protein
MRRLQEKRLYYAGLLNRRFTLPIPVVEVSPFTLLSWPTSALPGMWGITRVGKLERCAPYGRISLRKLQADRERCFVAAGHCRWSQYEAIATPKKNPIVMVPRGARSVCGIGKSTVNQIRHVIVEI